MAFQNKNLSVIAYANGFTLWHYTASESFSIILKDNYFDGIKTLMNTGDIIIINAESSVALCKVNSDEDKISVSVIGK